MAHDESSRYDPQKGSHSDKKHKNHSTKRRERKSSLSTAGQRSEESSMNYKGSGRRDSSFDGRSGCSSKKRRTGTPRHLSSKRRRTTSKSPDSRTDGAKAVREWDVGKLRHEPFANDQMIRPNFEPSGFLNSAEKSRSGKKQEPERERPSFEPSGKLAKDTNLYKGVLIKYNEPPEAKLPRVRWRLYPFKGEEHLPVIYVHRQSAYLIGKDRKISDFPVDHPSCSRQHAALQYRSLQYERSNGSFGRRTRPYIIDLESANGTFLNGIRIESKRYYELKERDVLRFGFSTREFVLLSEQSLYQDKSGDESDEDDVGGVGIDDEAQERFKKADRDDDDLF